VQQTREREISKAFIIKLKENVENTKGLLSIHFGKYKTIGILDLYKKDPQYYDNSLVSSKIVRDYFKRFISEDKVQEQFDYPLPCIEGTMYELLSKKASLINSYNAYAKGKYSLCFCFQFKTARENFAVIEKNTKTIIVPYDKGKEIIADLISAQDLKKKAFLLKQAQYYSVNIFENKFKQLQSLGAIKDCDIEGVYLLAEGFYSHDTGIALDGRLDFLCQ
jgi:CRISPR-associated endonuclease/helicase Cas3